MAGNTATLTLKILADVKDAQKGLADAEGASGKFSAGVKGAAVPAAAALAGLAVAGLDMAKAAAEDQAAADQLALALRNSAGASDASIAATEAWITNTSKAAAVADDELRPALATLVRATGDVATSQDAMGVALDVSAATGKDVGSVSDALAKAYAGQTTSLGKLVPGMDKAILASGDMDAIMAELARTTGGAAAEAAGSAEGQVKGMEIAMGEAQETIGSALLPALSGMATVLATVATFVQENSTLFLVLAGVIGTVAAVILALNVGLKVYNIVQGIMAINTARATAGQWALNAAFLANPITWIIVGIVALIAAIVLIATKTTWFQDIWETVWGAITAVASAAWEFIKGAAQAAIDWIVGIWESLKAAVQAVWDWIVNAAKMAWDLIVAGVKFYINIYITIFETIKKAVGAVWDWIVNAARAAFDWIKGIVQRSIDGWKNIFQNLGDFVSNIWEGLKSAAQRAFDAILVPINAVKSAFDKVVDAIRSVIDWLGKIKVPDVLGSIGSALDAINPFSAAAASSGTPLAAPAPTARNLRASSPVSASGGVNLTVNVPESSDPVATARYLRALIRRGEASGVIFGAL